MLEDLRGGKMIIRAAAYRSDLLLASLFCIWELSVRATHTFLQEDDIARLEPFVRAGLKEITTLIVAENKGREVVGFMGVADNKLEMLFVEPLSIGTGVGRALLSYGIEQCSVLELAVNEQNPKAREFYECFGFVAYKRSAYDEQGNSFPLVYMRLAK